MTARSQPSASLHGDEGEGWQPGQVGGYWWRNHLRHWRAVAGLSLSEAARRIGCSKAHLHDLESGRSSNPSIVLLLGIATTYRRGLMEVAFYAAGLGEKTNPTGQ